MCRIITTEIFIKEAKELNGNKYDYSKVKYINSQTKVVIICPKIDHGEFKQSPNSHLNLGAGCPKCVGRNKTTEDFIRLAKLAHPNANYDYSHSKYCGAHTKVIIICPKHGKFKQAPNHHISHKSGCSDCGIENSSIKQAFTTTKFIERAKQINVNRNVNYEYDKTVYKNDYTEVEIKCLIHGYFKQKPRIHLNCIVGCPECGEISMWLKHRLTQEEFISMATQIHSNTYDYSITLYKGRRKKISIICREHGVFKQIANAHLSGSGCQKCYGKIQGNNSSFKKKAKTVHGNMYEYGLVNYKNNYTKVTIICKKDGHGVFNQVPANHLMGQGCPKCSESKGEKKIRLFLINHNIEYVPQKTFEDCRSIHLLLFDFYLPNHNICIEYDGEQHFKAFKIFGGNKALQTNIKRDNIKTKYCKKEGIKLVRIKYTEDIKYRLNQELLRTIS